LRGGGRDILVSLLVLLKKKAYHYEERYDAVLGEGRGLLWRGSVGRRSIFFGRAVKAAK